MGARYREPDEECDTNRAAENVDSAEHESQLVQVQFESD